MKNRMISLLLTVALLAGLLSAFTIEAEAATSYIVGNNVTIPNSNVPADGSNPYCECDDAVGRGHHWCCWQYAYHTSYYIWGEYPSKKDESTHYLRNIAAEDRTLTEAHLKKYLLNAAPGALVRLDKRSTPTDGDNNGHSLIFVKMNATGDGAIFLEGNHDGKGHSQIHEWKFTDLLAAYGPGSSANYKYIKYICWPNAPAYEEPPAFAYETQCVKYPCGLELAITADCAPWTLPCDSDTAAEFGYTSTQLLEQALSIDDTVTATALYQNSKGDYWYLITLPDGSNAYLFCQFTESIGPILPWIENGSFPTQIYGATPLEGIIKSYGMIETIQGQVYTGTSVWENVAIQSDTVAVSDFSYVLRRSDVDNSLSFGQLSQHGAGDYTLAYDVAFYTYYADGNVLNSAHLSAMVGEFPFHFGEEECAHSNCTRVVTEPTCTTDGFTTFTCADCGYSYQDLPVAALGHDYADGCCLRCGEAEPQEAPVGDVNGDDAINYLDAILILQYYVGEIDEDALNTECADVNGDQSVNYLDAILILQYYVGEIDTFPKTAVPQTQGEQHPYESMFLAA